MPYVLDACALIAFLRDEPGAQVVEEVLRLPETHTHALNLCEVYYDFLRATDDATALGVVSDIKKIGIRVSEDMSETLWQKAGRYKVQFRMSLADAICVAFANSLTATVVTSDRREFEPVAKAGLTPIRFIR